MALLGGAAVAGPLAARAQQPRERIRRIGFLTFGAEDNVAIQGLIGVLREGLQSLGWIEGRNLHIEFRFGNSDPDRTRAVGTELVRSAPDLIVVNYGFAARTVREQTKTIPIVIAGVGDPVEGGLIRNIARPEGNVTSYTNLYASIGGKWLELLLEAAPHLKRIAVVVNPQLYDDPTNFGPPYRAIETAASAFRSTRVIPMLVHDTAEMESALAVFGREPNGGLIAVPGGVVVAPRQLIALAIQNRLPAIFQSRNFVVEGGLMSYGSFAVQFYRGLASYIDRILRGTAVADLPVQYPTKFELAINLRTAKAIGLEVPSILIARADEVIE